MKYALSRLVPKMQVSLLQQWKKHPKLSFMSHELTFNKLQKYG